jgi:hypothetical protein
MREESKRRGKWREKETMESLKEKEEVISAHPGVHVGGVVVIGEEGWCAVLMDSRLHTNAERREAQ